MSALAFYIDAPLQSWGASSKFQYRETNAFPTKSALVGLIAAALGIDKHASDEAEHLKALSDLKLTVVRIELAQRTPSRLTDFHTVGGGYDKKAPLWEKMSIPKKASGAAFGTVITRRSYLCDTSFVAIWEGDAATLARVQAALLDPVWGVWFGRKTCLPASPLTPTLGEDRQKAFDALLERLPEQTPTSLEAFEYQEELQSDSEQDSSFYQSDQAIAFGQHHGAVPAAYRARNIRQHRPVKES
ncbi:MAG TPA: type I-E CRISPR-associated protein Cas5/CasD [Opitutae bacterium]|nr:type I-E CRISPR-associated protein Cas5/CasD [Puniceicoccaceae bacterium]HBR94997.1 type I-E CRISPR-associated protein Cas5/CasD [Opitutae bacterium]|tara:strand:- start:9979 stop:10710 length:732 start_codon:yes stop_codon:yes gene_type:complete